LSSSTPRDPSLDRDVRATLITVTHNSSDTLRHFWADAASQGLDWVVVDNASSDDSAAAASALGARVVPSTENLGFSRANNLGARHADSDVLIFCNPDIRVTRDGVRALASHAVSTGGLVAPQLCNSDGTLQENGRGTPFPHRKLRHMFGEHDAQDSYVRLARPGELRQVVWVMGAAVAMTREVFDCIGGWNDRYFIYYEDAEICLRALRMGVPTFVDGDTRWEHGWARETQGAFSRSAWRHEVRSGLRFYLTHPHCVIPVGRAAAELRAVDGMTPQTQG
jgi:N-acetylglucosaminyl-diphospho-decaprenol L-rhamnosyltransferase